MVITHIHKVAGVSVASGEEAVFAVAVVPVCARCNAGQHDDLTPAERRTGHLDVFLIGDLATFPRLEPIVRSRGSLRGAIQQGQFVTRLVARGLSGLATEPSRTGTATARRSSAAGSLDILFETAPPTDSGRQASL